MGDDTSNHYDETTIPDDVNRINENFEARDAMSSRSVSRSAKRMRDRPPIAIPRDPPISPPPPIERLPNPPKTKYPTPQPVKKDIAMLQNQPTVVEMPRPSQEVKSEPGPVDPDIESPPPVVPRRNNRTPASGIEDPQMYDVPLKEEEGYQ